MKTEAYGPTQLGTVSVVRPLHGAAWLWSRYFLQSFVPRMKHTEPTYKCNFHLLCNALDCEFSQCPRRSEGSNHLPILLSSSRRLGECHHFLGRFLFAFSVHPDVMILFSNTPYFPGGTVTVRCQIALDSSEQCAWLPSDAF